ncbi:patatin-like phospholipase family protein [Paracoccus sp. Ld10]|uniref:patatin-like phospholipase family protein n=1 Tax=Paracoccus sp. Ld10 TaxID=649158 RepID=UPI00386D4F49
MCHTPTTECRIGRRHLLLGLGATALSACTSRIDASALTTVTAADDPLSGFRFFADDGPDEWLKHLHPPQSSWSATGPKVLALSGGGEDGAFGAGALVGWSARGDRPDFDLVTGISTGALIAPFAFMGQDYDDVLTQVFTQTDANDIMRLRPFQAVFSNALFDTTPLAELIAEFTPPAFIQAVARRHATGKNLLVVTSELDSARASVWDMGAIAQAGQYDLFRGVMRASAALPGLFPPVSLSFASRGKTYSETHIDGGVHMQFLAVPSFAFTMPDQELEGGHIYVIINNTLNPAPEPVGRSALSISQQALTTTGRASALLQVNATQLFAREKGLRFSVTSIDPNAGVRYDPSDRFSSTYMNALYRHGRDRAQKGSLWTKSCEERAVPLGI